LIGRAYASSNQSRGAYKAKIECRGRGKTMKNPGGQLCGYSKSFEFESRKRICKEGGAKNMKIRNKLRLVGFNGKVWIQVAVLDENREKRQGAD